MEQKMERSIPENRSGQIEIVISALGSVVCYITTYLIWRSLITYQDFWLLPGLYFIELLLGASICFLAYLLKSPQASTITWIYSGILCVFILLASFTVGILFVPVFLIFTALSLFSTIRQRLNLLPKLGLFLCAGLIQLALMLIIIWFQ
jgi:hypothetical protein